MFISLPILAYSAPFMVSAVLLYTEALFYTMVVFLKNWE